MSSDFKTAMKQRRSYYTITSESPISDAEIQEIINFAVLHTPTPFNSQSGRVVLLFGKEHAKLWEIVRETLRKMIPAEKFTPTDDKISSFAAGHGTVLFFEDKAVVERLQKELPTYAEMQPWLSSNATGILQFAVWCMLCDAGLGASLQHYGNLIQEQVAKTWGLSEKWLLIAQMPFGKPGAEPGPKEFEPLETRVKVFS